ncbi:uncharacterized protein LOC111689690 [Lucilia cuprina]|uniref:uncharacterized protein LOC111689690 n=1 Tax=Lucilia cuprina TaxID=7375 RepID=UPI001F06F83E|nr:uncharacterized protein LOC111689690 [Lucilia cuprina]
MFSDNGRNFVGAAKQIDFNFEKYIQEFRGEAVSKYVHQQLSWHFIPASTPHMGGLWEARVKSVKTHFKKISGQIKYTFEEFSTILASIEACLNSCPLGPLPDSHDEPVALTPAHFLLGSTIITPPEPEEIQPAISIVNRWRKIKAMSEEFCRRWKDEYLKQLHKRSKWTSPQVDIKEQDLVVLKTESIGSTE